MKKILASILSASLMLCLAACGGAGTAAVSSSTETEITTASTQKETETEAVETNTEETATETESSDIEAGDKVLVVYFSATGTTKGVAERIAAIENADLYEITAAQPYTSEDLDYGDSNSRTTIEQNDKNVRPEISSDKLDLTGYTTIYIGYPIWWGEEPRIMDTFVEIYDFGNITMIPFCTSGGSGIGRSGSNLAENAGSGNWLSGDRLQSNISDEDLADWINSCK